MSVRSVETKQSAIYADFTSSRQYNQTASAMRWGCLYIKELIMFQPVFEGDNFSYFYEEDIEQYLLIDKKCKNNLFLKNIDALIFIEQIKLINTNYVDD